MSEKKCKKDNLYQNFIMEVQNEAVSHILSLDPSGAYVNMTNDTKALYLSLVSEKAKKEKVSKEEYAHKLL